MGSLKLSAAFQSARARRSLYRDGECCECSRLFRVCLAFIARDKIALIFRLIIARQTPGAQHGKNEMQIQTLKCTWRRRYEWQKSDGNAAPS